jgi:hypothetical protein
MGDGGWGMGDGGWGMGDGGCDELLNLLWVLMEGCEYRGQERPTRQHKIGANTRQHEGCGR